MIVVANKADLALPAAGGCEDELEALAAEAAARGVREGEREEEVEEGRRRGVEGVGGRVWKVSCKTKEGLDGFMAHLEAEVRSRFQGAADDESPLITR